MQYRKKPIVVEAFCYGTDAPAAWFLEGVNNLSIISYATHCDIHTLEGTMRADIGDWVIRGVEGELYPCKAPIFIKTYEPVEKAKASAKKEPPEAKKPKRKK